MGRVEVAMLRRNFDLLIVAALAVAGLVAGLLSGLYPVIRGVFSVPLLVALPGYALTAALIPDRQSLGRTERTVLGVGMSIVLVILSGLGLNLLPAGITNVSVSLTLAAITLVAAAIGLARRRGQPDREPVVDLDGPEVGDVPEAVVGRRRERPNGYGPEFLALAVILTVAAIFVGVLGAVRAPQTQFTQFWLLTGADPNVIQVGIRDEEGQPVAYRIEVETQGQVLRTAEIDLSQGDDTVQTIKLPALTGTTPQTVTARLFRLDQTSTTVPYRTTLAWRYPGKG
jgi:uncharacterized membrane protein